MISPNMSQSAAIALQETHGSQTELEQLSLRQRSMADILPEDVATRAAGRHLDVLWAAAGIRLPAPIHDGQHCQDGGCRSTICGAR